MLFKLSNTNQLNSFKVIVTPLLIVTLTTCVSTSSKEALVTCQGSANYNVTFDSTWSRSTHPDNFPSNPHLSRLIGAVHNDSIRFWQEGQLASPGIKDVAELGGNRKFKQEIEQAIMQGKAKSLINAPDIKRSPDRINVEINLDRDHSKVTLLSMIAPSPDWFVGVSGLDLCEDGSWLMSKKIALGVYDSGTDSGKTYTAKNSITYPSKHITQVTSGIYNKNGIVPSLATLTFNLID
jgi:hypothetical protein